MRCNSEALTIEGSDSAHDDMVSSGPGAASTPARQGRSASMCNPSRAADTGDPSVLVLYAFTMHFLIFAPFFACHIGFSTSGLSNSEPTAMACVGRALSESIAFSPCGPSQRERALTLGDVMGPEGPLQDEIQHHGEVMKDSVEAQLTIEKMLEAGIEPADIEDLKVSKQATL